MINTRGKTEVIEIEASATLGELKNRVSWVTGVPTHLFRITASGSTHIEDGDNHRNGNPTLDTSRTLIELGLNQETTIRIQLRILGGGKGRGEFWCIYHGKQTGVFYNKDYAKDIEKLVSGFTKDSAGLRVSFKGYRTKKEADDEWLTAVTDPFSERGLTMSNETRHRGYAALGMAIPDWLMDVLDNRLVHHEDIVTEMRNRKALGVNMHLVVEMTLTEA
jgi:hypothetical protein